MVRTILSAEYKKMYWDSKETTYKKELKICTSCFRVLQLFTLWPAYSYQDKLFTLTEKLPPPKKEKSKKTSSAKSKK